MESPGIQPAKIDQKSSQLWAELSAQAAADVVISDQVEARILGGSSKPQSFVFLMTECAASLRRLIKNLLCHGRGGENIWPEGLSTERRHLHGRITETEARRRNHREWRESRRETAHLQTPAVFSSLWRSESQLIEEKVEIKTKVGLSQIFTIWTHRLSSLWHQIYMLGRIHVYIAKSAPV